MRHTDEMIAARNSIGASIIGWACAALFVAAAYQYARFMLDVVGLVPL